MALKEQGQSTESVIYIDFVSEAGPTDTAPFFCTKKVVDGNREIDKKFGEVSGKVISVVKNETEWKGKPVRAFRINIEDGEEKIVISPTLTNGSKNLLNACLGSIGKEIVLKPYLNNGGYPDVSCKKADGEFAETAFEYNDKELFDKIWDKASDKNEKVEDTNKAKEEISVEDIPF